MTPAGPSIGSIDGPRRWPSILGFTTITVAPWVAEIHGNEAAGSTTFDVPTERNTSHATAACRAASNSAIGIGSPNHTTSGRIRAPQRWHVGGSAASSSVSGIGPGHPALHRARMSEPCRLITSRDPARSCRSSTFWVTSVQCATREASVTSAW